MTVLRLKEKSQTKNKGRSEVGDLDRGPVCPPDGHPSDPSCGSLSYERPRPVSGSRVSLRGVLVSQTLVPCRS